MKWLIIILVLGALGGGGFAGFGYWTNHQGNDPARPALTLKSVRLGQDINDIQFELGKRLPRSAVGNFVVYRQSLGTADDAGAGGSEPAASDTSAGPKAVTADAAPGGEAVAGESVPAPEAGRTPSMRLFTTEDLVAGVSYDCATGTDDTALDQVQCGQPLAEIQHTYQGLEVVQFCNSADVLSRYVDLPRQGKSFLLVRNKIVELWIRRAGQPAQFPHDEGWKTCGKRHKA